MWFKNLKVYELASGLEVTAEELREMLGSRLARDCGPLEQMTIGWVPPIGKGDLLIEANQCRLMCARISERKVPADVLSREVAARVSEIEDEEQRKLRRKEIKEIKENALDELMPKAFQHDKRVYLYVDMATGKIIVDAATWDRAEAVVELLRDSIGSLPVRQQGFAQSIPAVLTSWLSGSHPGAGFEVLEECELRDKVEDGGIVRCSRQNLASDEIRQHLEAGKHVTRLALDLNGRMQFVVEADGAVSKLKFLDVVIESASEEEDEAGQFMADFTIATEEIRDLIGRLIEEFGGAV